MPYAYVGKGAGADFVFGSGSMSATYAAGETVFVVCGAWDTVQPTAPTCSDGTNTYTLIATFGVYCSIWKADNVAAGTYTLSCTSPGVFGGGFNYFRYTGLAAGAVQVSNGATVTQSGAGGTDNLSGPTVLPTGQPAMVFSAGVNQNNSTGTIAGTGFTKRGQLQASETRGCVMDQRITTTSLVTPLFTTTDTFEDFQIATIIVSEAATGQFARPDVDVTDGAWLPSTGADLYATLDETAPADTDYDYTTTPSTMEVSLGTLTDPAVSTGHVVRYRIWGALLPKSKTLVVSLRQGATQIAAWTHSGLPAEPTTFERTLSGAEADSITDYTDLRLRFVAS